MQTITTQSRFWVLQQALPGIWLLLVRALLLCGQLTAAQGRGIVALP